MTEGSVPLKSGIASSPLKCPCRNLAPSPILGRTLALKLRPNGRAVGVAVVVSLLTSACADSTSSSQTSTTIRRADFRKWWPFKVKEGTLVCVGAGAVTFEANGTVYAVNGTAGGQGFAEIELIWRDDPDNPGLKVNIGPVIDRGLALCSQGG
jgi:Protein of unknown function (DUF2511)